MADRDDTPQLEAVGLAGPIKKSFLITWPNVEIEWMVVRRRGGQPSVGIYYTGESYADMVVLYMSDGGLQACFEGPLTQEQLTVLEKLADRTD